MKDVASMETGQRPITMRTIDKLAPALGNDPAVASEVAS